MILHINALPKQKKPPKPQKVESNFQNKLQALASKHITLYFIKMEIKFLFYKRLIQIRRL